MPQVTEGASTRMLEVPLGGGEMTVCERPGEGATVVLVHALSGTSASWRRVIGELPGELRVLAPDLRGRGGTTIPGEGGLDAHVGDLAGLLEALGAWRPVLCGHSFGAVLSVAAARARPGVAGALVLVDGGTRPPDAALAAARNAVARAEARWETPERFLGELRGSYAWERAWSPALAEELRGDLRWTGEEWATGADPAVIAADIEAMAGFLDADRPSSAPIAALGAGGGVLGSDDPVLGTRELDLLRDGWGVTVRTVPDARHTSFLYTHPHEVAAACSAAVGYAGADAHRDQKREEPNATP